jgi:hypothetical protein
VSPSWYHHQLLIHAYSTSPLPPPHIQRHHLLLHVIHHQYDGSAFPSLQLFPYLFIIISECALHSTENYKMKVISITSRKPISRW